MDGCRNNIHKKLQFVGLLFFRILPLSLPRSTFVHRRLRKRQPAKKSLRRPLHLQRIYSVSHKHKIASRGRYTERRKTYIALNKFTGSRSTNLCACTSDGLGFQRDKPAQWFSPFDNYQNGASCRFTKFFVNNKCTQV